LESVITVIIVASLEAHMASSVNLGPVLEEIVDKLVANGRFNSRSEVLREGVRIVHEREAKVAKLAAYLAPAIADADAGRTLSGKQVFDALRAQQKELSKVDAS
jgi:antitoxin ParD1/3/4